MKTNTIVFHKTKQMSSSDSNYDNNNTDTDSNNNSDNDSSEDKDVLEEVLPVDIACQQHQQPMESDICVLTNAIPPIHFLFLPQCYWNTERRAHTVDYVISCFHNNIDKFHEGKLPFHQACKVKATQSMLKKLFNVYPNAVKQKTKDNNDMALHCYLLLSRASMNQEMKETITFLVEKNIDACSLQNNNKWHPVHIVAFHNLLIDISYHMAKTAPITIIPDEHVH